MANQTATDDLIVNEKQRRMQMDAPITITLNFSTELVTSFQGWGNRNAAKRAEEIKSEIEKKVDNAEVKVSVTDVIMSHNGVNGKFEPFTNAVISVKGSVSEHFDDDMSDYHRECIARRHLDDLIRSFIENEEDAYRTNTLISASRKRIAV